MATLALIHGPNLNMLGSREPEKYGLSTLDDIDQEVGKLAETRGHKLNHFQSNSEATIIEHLHTLAGKADFIIINPAALTHTSVALRDALLAISIPFIEVHLSNIHAREPFRHHSYLSDIAQGVISGFGANSYYLATHAACDWLANKDKTQ